MAGVSVAAFQKLLATGRDSDFTIKCRGVSFKVHQLVMKSASPFFRAACEGEFKERHEACVELPEDDPGIIAFVIQYTYLGCFILGAVTQFEYLTESENELLGKLWKNIKTSVGFGEHERKWHWQTLATPTEVAACLSLGVYVYQLADKLGMEQLEVVSATLFESRNLDKIAGLALINFLRLVYATLPTGTTERLAITKHFIKKHGSSELGEEITDIIQKNEPMAWDVGYELAIALGQRGRRINELKSEVKDLEDQTESLTEQLEEEKRMRQKEAAYNEKVIQYLASPHYCPFCTSISFPKVQKASAITTTSPATNASEPGVYRTNEHDGIHAGVSGT